MVATRTGSQRPPIMGTTHAVSSGHYLASAAGYRILEQGGNATDAGVAGGIAINVLLPDMTSFGGVAPIMIFDSTSDDVSTISGLGRWPRAASADYFLNERGGDIPIGVERVVVPAAAGAWLTALEEHGNPVNTIHGKSAAKVMPSSSAVLPSGPATSGASIAKTGMASSFDRPT